MLIPAQKHLSASTDHGVRGLLVRLSSVLFRNFES